MSLTGATVFESTHGFAFFDYVRVPYIVTANARSASRDLPNFVGRLLVADEAANGPSLCWLPVESADRLSRRWSRRGRFKLGGIPLVGHVSSKMPTALESLARGWRPAEPILDAGGKQVGSTWVADDGSVFLPFDPGEVMQHLWSESYTTVGSAAAMLRWARKGMVQCYYAVRPLVPRRYQLAMRRVLARRQAPPSFPRWPIEDGLHDLYAWLLSTVTAMAGRPVPWLDPWPDGKSWALVLTHDVETQVGVGDIPLLRDGERANGFRSSWNFVPERYDVADDVLQQLRDEGCEIGVHGLRHDGRDLASRRLLEQRLPAIRKHAERWAAVGFRSPATQRAWDLMPLLGFDYDSSYTDTDPYEPQPGGCCTYLPYFNQRMVELPITLPQDHTVFEILQRNDGELWTGKARELRARGGMVLVLAHPDYARDERLALAWKELLDEFVDDNSMWQPLPRDVADWWRRRDDSVPVPEGDGWIVSGPAAGRARVRMTAAPLTAARIEQ